VEGPPGGMVAWSFSGGGPAEFPFSSIFPSEGRELTYLASSHPVSVPVHLSVPASAFLSATLPLVSMMASLGGMTNNPSSLSLCRLILKLSEVPFTPLQGFKAVVLVLLVFPF